MLLTLYGRSLGAVHAIRSMIYDRSAIGQRCAQLISQWSGRRKYWRRTRDFRFVVANEVEQNRSDKDRLYDLARSSLHLSAWFGAWE